MLTEFVSPNIRGPRGPAGSIDGLEDAVGDIIDNKYPPKPGDEGDAPWVHKGKGCSDPANNIDENVYGQKTFRYCVGFEPCDPNKNIMHWKVGDNRDFRMFFKKNIKGAVTLDGFTLQRDNTGSPGLTVGFEKGSGSPQVGIKVPTPYYGVDIKGAGAASQWIARPNGDAGKEAKNNYSRYTNGALVTKVDTYELMGDNGKIPTFRVYNAGFDYRGAKNRFLVAKK